jgi:hypothetical protein
MKGTEMFFFEKKNQKTSITLGHGFGRSNTRVPDKKKFFCFFLFTKRSPLLPECFL